MRMWNEHKVIREKVICSGMKMLAEKGWESVSMAEISKNAKTAIGTIYNYFPSKDNLINQIYLYIVRERGQWNKLDLDKDGVKLSLYNFLINYIYFFRRRPKEYFLFLDHFKYSPIISDEIKREAAAYFMPLASILLRGQEEKLIKPFYTISELSHYVEENLSSFFKWVYYEQGNPNRTDPTLVMIWDGIKHEQIQR